MGTQKVIKPSTNYWLTFCIICGTIFLIYLFFTTKVENFQIYVGGQINPTGFGVIVLSIMLGYEFALKNYFFVNVYLIFEKLEPLFQKNQYQIFSRFLQKRLLKSHLHYLIIVVVLAPVAIIELYRLVKYDKHASNLPYYCLLNYNNSRLNDLDWNNKLGDLAYYCIQTNNHWVQLLDIFTELVSYYSLYLMAVVIWMTIELTLIINHLRKYTFEIDIFDKDEIGRLKPLKSFVLLIMSSYFIITALAIIAYTPPDYQGNPIRIIKNYEDIVFILAYLILGISTIGTQKTIRGIISKGVEFELKRIDRKYKETYDKVIGISSNKLDNANEKYLNELKIILEILEKEERKINEINKKMFNFKEKSVYLTSLLLPVFTILHYLFQDIFRN